MNILVIGGQGFIGYNLVLKLLKEGHNIIIFDKNINKERYLSCCEYVAGDFIQIDKFKHILKDVDVVYHLISTTVPHTSNDNLVYDIESNVVSSIKLFEMCCEADIKKIIFSSSGGTVYGVPNLVPIKEEHYNKPISAYGISKLMIEKYLYMFKYQHGLNYKILRIANPYGPYQNPLASQGVIGVFLGKILKGEDIKIWGDGTICRDYIFIEDVVEALYLASIKNTNSNILNIGSGRGITLNNLILIIEEVLGLNMNVIYEESRNVDIPINILNIKKAVDELGWYPKVDIDCGIRRTWDWLINN